MGPYLSLEKENVCVMFTYSIKQVHEIMKFHVAVLQQQLRSVQKSMSSPSLLKLSIVAIQIFCYYGNVM